MNITFFAICSIAAADEIARGGKKRREKTAAAPIGMQIKMIFIIIVVVVDGAMKVTTKD